MLLFAYVPAGWELLRERLSDPVAWLPGSIVEAGGGYRGELHLWRHPVEVAYEVEPLTEPGQVPAYRVVARPVPHRLAGFDAEVGVTPESDGGTRLGFIGGSAGAEGLVARLIAPVVSRRLARSFVDGVMERLGGPLGHAASPGDPMR